MSIPKSHLNSSEKVVTYGITGAAKKKKRREIISLLFLSVLTGLLGHDEEGLLDFAVRPGQLRELLLGEGERQLGHAQPAVRVADADGDLLVPHPLHLPVPLVQQLRVLQGDLGAGLVAAVVRLDGHAHDRQVVEGVADVLRNQEKNWVWCQIWGKCITCGFFFFL